MSTKEGSTPQGPELSIQDFGMRYQELDCTRGYFPQHNSVLVFDRKTENGKLSEFLRNLKFVESHILGVESIHKSLFPEGSFDRIISNGNLPIKIEEDLPELLRILAPGGEIRMANYLNGKPIQFIHSRNNLILGLPKPNKEPDAYLGLVNALKLISKDKSINSYLAFYDRDKFRMHDMVNIIFRKDEKWPEFQTDDSESSLYTVRYAYKIGNPTLIPKGYRLLYENKK